jgi:ribonuclease HI
MRRHRDHEHPPQNLTHPIRSFDPKWNDLYKNNPSYIITTCECCGDNKVRVRGTGYGRHRTQEIDPNSVVVSIASDSRYNRTESATASWSVYWGPGSRHNDADQLSKHFWEPARQTTDAAAVEAAKQVLMKMLMMLDDEEDDKNTMRGGLEVCKLLILTDSMYLVKGISEHIWKWNKNGYKTAKKRPVVNGDAFSELDGYIADLEDRGIPVWFWLVKKEWNQEADALAKHALDEKPNASLYILDPETGGITTGRNWIKHPESGRTVLAPEEKLDFERD